MENSSIDLERLRATPHNFLSVGYGRLVHLEASFRMYLVQKFHRSNQNRIKKGLLFLNRLRHVRLNIESSNAAYSSVDKVLIIKRLLAYGSITELAICYPESLFIVYNNMHK